MSYLNEFAHDWTLVDLINPSAATLVTFKSGGNGIANYPVNGNVDGGYLTMFDLSGDGTNGLGATLRLQAGTTNQTWVRIAANTTSGVFSTSGTGMYLLGQAAVANPRTQGWWKMEASATGQQRMSIGVVNNWCAAASPTQNVNVFFGKYADSATNITSIDFDITSAGSHLQSGVIRLYVKNPQQPPLWGLV